MNKYKPKTQRNCASCDGLFSPVNGNQKYCSRPCKRKAYQASGGCESTEKQYNLISGNWAKYFSRLCQKSFRRDLLSKHDCIELLEKQNYKCALTGVELTCILQKGVVTKTNASIDRINPKGEYTKDNVQLVCSIINKLRIDMDVNEFVEWCRKVADHAVCK